METPGEIIVTLASEDRRYSYDNLSVGYNSTDEEILDALGPVLLEETGFDIRDELRNGDFTIKRADNSQSIYVFPKSTAGVL